MMQSPTFDQMSSNQALHLFRESSLLGWFYRLWARLTNRSSRLLDLDEALCCSEVKNSHYAGIRPVCIDRIQGTLGKSDEFDAEFHPVKESSRSRWLSVALEKLRDHDLPPVELVDDAPGVGDDADQDQGHAAAARQGGPPGEVGVEVEAGSLIGVQQRDQGGQAESGADEEDAAATRPARNEPR